jgi:hypothetical protein
MLGTKSNGDYRGRSLMTKSTVPDRVRDRIHMPHEKTLDLRPVSTSKDHFHLYLEMDGWGGSFSPAWSYETALQEAHDIINESWVEEVRADSYFPFTLLFLKPNPGMTDQAYFRLVMRHCTGHCKNTKEDWG